MPIKFLLLGGGGVLGFFRRGGWKWQFYFGNPKCRERKCEERNGAGPFLETILQNTVKTQEIPENDRFIKRSFSETVLN